MKTTLGIILTAFAIWAGAVTAQAASLTPEEAKLQAQFKKGYANQSNPGERISAVDALAGAKHPSSWNMLVSVATSDRSQEVRLHAIEVLVACPARDPSIARMVSQCFCALRNADEKLRLPYAKAMSTLPFKHDVAVALSKYLAMLPYPEVYLIYRNTGRSNHDYVNRVRAEFEVFLNIFNTFVGTHIEPSAKAEVEVKHWVEDNRAHLIAADQKLIEQYRKEDAEAAKTGKQ